MDRATMLHNAAIEPLLRLIVAHADKEADQWVILEALCLGIGRLHGRDARGTATFIELMAERIVTGERS
jgi:hypothetical protein